MPVKLLRLSKTKEIDALHKKGRSFFTRYFVIKYLPNNLLNSRVAIIVSTKVSKKAVVRNNLRRQIKENLRLLLPTSFKKDLLVLVSKNSVAADGRMISVTDLKSAIAFAIKNINR